MLFTCVSSREMARIGSKASQTKRKKMKENRKRLMDGLGLRLSQRKMGLKFFSNMVKKVKKVKVENVKKIKVEKVKKMKVKVKKVKVEKMKKVKEEKVEKVKKMRNMKKESKGDIIPDELLFEIWSRLPANYLWSLRSICKGWQSLIESPLLSNLHLCRSKEEEEMPIIFWDEEGYSDPTIICSIDKEDGSVVRVIEDVFLHPGMFTLSSTDGLICYFGTDERIRVHNTVTRELVILPTPDFFSSKPFQYDRDVHNIDIALGFDSVIEKYKVMAVLTLLRHNEPVHCAPKVVIYTLERGSQGWRNVEVPDYYWHPRFCANGFVYWGRSENTKSQQRVRSFVKFNFSEERFESVPLPSDVEFHSCDGVWNMWEVRGSLWLSKYQHTRKEVMLWTLGKSGEWVVQYIVPPSSRDCVHAYPISSGMMLAETYEERYIFFYSEEGQALRSIEIQGLPHSMFPIQRYSGSLVSLKSIGAAAAHES